MKIAPSDRLTISHARKAMGDLVKTIENNRSHRDAFITLVVMAEVLVAAVAAKYGSRSTWDWLQSICDTLLEDELENEPKG